MEPFLTLKVGLTSGSQSRSQGHTPGCYTDIGSQVPCIPGSRTGIWVWEWAWRNKYIAPILFCAYLQELIHLNLPLPLDYINELCARNKHVPRNDVTKMDIYWGFYRIRIFLFDPFTNICTLFRNTLSY